MSETEITSSESSTEQAQSAPVSQDTGVREKVLNQLAKSDDVSDYIQERKDRDAEAQGDDAINRPDRKAARQERLQKAIERASEDVRSDSPQAEQAAENTEAESSRPMVDDYTRAQFDMRAAQFAEINPDFENITKTVFEYVRPSDVAFPIIARSEVGPELAFTLAQNPMAIAELNDMQPHDQVYALGVIEGNLRAQKAMEKRQAQPAPSARRVSKAPPPMKALSGGAMPPTDIKTLAKSYDATAYVQERNRQERARSGR